MDAQKSEPVEEAGTSAVADFPAGDNSSLPPVYVVVDKTKKTKKPLAKSVSRVGVNGLFYSLKGYKFFYYTL